MKKKFVPNTNNSHCPTCGFNPPQNEGGFKLRDDISHAPGGLVPGHFILCFECGELLRLGSDGKTLNKLTESDMETLKELPFYEQALTDQIMIRARKN